MYEHMRRSISILTVFVHEDLVLVVKVYHSSRVHHTCFEVDFGRPVASWRCAFDPFLLDPRLLFLRLRLIRLLLALSEFEDSSELG